MMIEQFSLPVLILLSFKCGNNTVAPQVRSDRPVLMRFETRSLYLFIYLIVRIVSKTLHYTG